MPHLPRTVTLPLHSERQLQAMADIDQSLYTTLPTPRARIHIPVAAIRSALLFRNTADVARTIWVRAPGLTDHAYPEGFPHAVPAQSDSCIGIFSLTPAVWLFPDDMLHLVVPATDGLQVLLCVLDDVQNPRTEAAA